MRRTILLITLLAAVVAAQQQPRPDRAEDRNPLRGDPNAVVAGSKLFSESCGACHGPNGEGGRGPNLVDGRAVRRLNDRELMTSIRKGVPGTDMPPSPLPEEKLWQITAFVRGLSSPAFESPVAGNAEAGGALFFGKAGCSNCHMIRGRGGFLGPDLANVGQLRSEALLHESIVNPNRRLVEGFQGASIVTAEGQKIEGIAKNLTNYSVQVLDAAGELHLLDRARLKSMSLRAVSAMPADYAKRLSKAEIQNLVAYLGRQSIRGGAGAFVSPPAGAAPVSFEDIRRSPNDNWLTYAGDYQARRHSPLAAIDTANVKGLAPAWTFHVDTARKLEATPLVADGVMYVTNSNEIFALDARNGRRIWTYRDDQATVQRVNRGAALLGDRVFFVTGDNYLVALHRKSGAVLWSQKYADTKDGYFATLAPLAIKDRVLVGVGGGDSGMRGFVAALSASTGEELWRFYTIPAKGEPGSETWAQFPLQWAGAGTWLSGTYDPDLNLVYWTTGNPWPDFYGGDRKGDNLYSASVVALDLATGKLKWHFQFTPHDTHDWDAQAFPVLVDTEYQGKMRKALLHPNRNGFLYLLDRTTGEYLRSTRLVDKLTWATGIDAKGRPIEVPDMDPTPGGKLVCPSVRGAANWMSPSYNPATGLLYVPTLEQCDIYTGSAKEPVPMQGFAGTGGERVPTELGRFYLRAFDPKTGQRVWEYPMTGPTTTWAGTVSTAGGLIFFGDDDGQLVAVDAKTGKYLWHYNMGQPLSASPIVYAVNGKEYVTIAAATDVFTFSLADR
jgi:PQQ-dependent dehydrogenase (methanol/ethanol family)